MFGGIIFQGTITSDTRTVVIPGNNLRFYIDTFITNINAVAVGARVSFIPKGETNDFRFVYVSATPLTEHNTGTIRTNLLSSGDTILMARFTITNTASTGSAAGLPIIYIIQARELVI